jgi:hypothetical protein
MTIGRFHYYVTFMICATVAGCMLMVTNCQRHQDALFPDAHHLEGFGPQRR